MTVVYYRCPAVGVIEVTHGQMGFALGHMTNHPRPRTVLSLPTPSLSLHEGKGKPQSQPDIVPDVWQIAFQS